MVDNGQTDEKIIAVCTSDPFYKDYNSIKDLPAHVSEQIKHFFTVYKTLEGKLLSYDSILSRNKVSISKENIINKEKE